MRLLSVKLARAIWLVHAVDLNPRGRNTLSLVRPLVDRYRFVQVPNKIEDFDLSKGIKFLGGNFKKNPQEEIAIDLTIYNDGIIADTRSSTDDTDVFLDELLTWISTEFGFVPYQDVLRSKVYVSELWVQTDRLLNALNPKLDAFAQRLTSLVAGHSHHPIAFETSGVSLWTDPTITNPPGPFRFERADLTPFGENRYYSAAPLQTSVHLQMLLELEGIIGS